MAEKIIEFRNIHKRFGGINAVKNVSFSINKGEVHTILGENGAGKSTLMNMLAGIYMPNEGEIIYKGEPVQITDPKKARDLGISTVFQELKLCPNLTVMENFFLGREIIKRGRLDWKQMNTQAERKLAELGLNINVSQRIMDLSAAQRQLVEIAKAMFINSEVLILDEPTSSLTIEEAIKLFDTVRNLKSKGVTIIFISHRMQEVMEISDRISIMRNGEFLATYDIGDVTPNKIIALISGKNELDIDAGNTRITRDFRKDRRIALEVRGLCNGRQVQNVSFKLYEGEILGFYGLQGAGRTELMETIYGLRKAEKGEVLVFGDKLTAKGVSDVMEHGIAMVPEDRKGVGLFMNMDICNNVNTMHGKDIQTKLHMLNRARMRTIAENASQRLSIRSHGITQMVSDLSGGNQQKVVISKCLSISPRILIMDEPTRGVDVGAKAEIFNFLRALREDQSQRVSIVVISSELSEVVQECDRVLIMREGRIVGELSGNEITNNAVLEHAFNGTALPT